MRAGPVWPPGNRHLSTHLLGDFVCAGFSKDRAHIDRAGIRRGPYPQADRIGPPPPGSL